jgi:hypothetical protein
LSWTVLVHQWVTPQQLLRMEQVVLQRLLQKPLSAVLFQDWSFARFLWT